ncbi:MAG: MnmC family methyltransferase [Hydrogenothermaceae bacterium]|nr:MnmC family methyltransferase [Hydrogenothermaceae bacterium]
MLKVGFIDYKNTIPFCIESVKNVEVIRDYPANLNKMLFEGNIDVGIVSSGEYIEHYYRYFIFPELSISGYRDVKSVAILSNTPLEDVSTIYLTKESKTSVLLTKVIFEKFLKKKPTYRYFDSIKNKETVLVIGDKALDIQQKFRYCYDLSKIWFDYTGLPFTFALWCVNKEKFFENREEVLQLYNQLKENKEDFFKSLENIKLDGYLKAYLRNIDYSLTEKHVESLLIFSEYLFELGYIKSIPDFKFIDGVVITRDKTKTIYNFNYKEAYHSTKAGAYTESFEKFVKPSNMKTILEKGQPITILDVGFGLGYNVATAINFAKTISKKPMLEIISIEKDINFLENIRKIDYPENLSQEYQFILSLKPVTVNISAEEIKGFQTREENITLTVLIDEGRKIINLLKREGKKFDTIFYDPFSPKVNTEMWTLDIFRVLGEIIKDDGILLTYSNAIPVKVGLLEAGFKIGYISPVGRRTPSLVATKCGDIYQILEEEIKKIRSSKFAVPYRDLDFSLTGKQIWENWEKEVAKATSGK